MNASAVSVMSAVKFPGSGDPCLIVAEIGQNHQGDLDIAKTLIRKAKECGADCVKFQKTCINEKFNRAALERIYDGPDSWGATYGEHKLRLEFTDEQYSELCEHAKRVGIVLFATAMDKVSVDFLANSSFPLLKIGSGDSNNLPLIRYAASKRIPLIVSTGMSDKATVDRIYESVKEYQGDFCLLHCVSSYPTPYEDCNLNVIKDFQKSYPDVCIGYSGHELGYAATLAAAALGAKVVERHITLDKTQKGSDHRCSLVPDEFREMIDQIRIIEKALGDGTKKIAQSEKQCMEKLRKSLVTATDLKRGHRISADDIKIKVAEPRGVDGLLHEEIIGRILKCDKSKDETIFETDFIT